MKAINLLMQCYKEKFELIKSEPELIKSEPELINYKRYMKDLGIYDT